MTRTAPRYWISAVLAAFLLIAGPSTAHADEDLVAPFALSQCSSGKFCLWSGTAYTGSFVGTAGGSTSMTTARSYSNQTSNAVRVYAAATPTGSSVCIPAGGQSASTTLASRYVLPLSSLGC